MNFLQKAQSEGIIFIDENHKEVFYKALNLKLPLNPEERVRSQVYAELIYKYRYPIERIVFEHPVKMGSSYKRVDILVFGDNARQKPFLLVECKKESISQQTFQEAIEQAFSYDNHPYTSYIWVTSGEQQLFYKAEHQSSGRKRYSLLDIPHFSWVDTLWYKIFEGGQFVWSFLQDFYEEFIAPNLQSKWFAQTLFWGLVFFLSSYGASWANEQWLTPYALKNKWLQRSFTFEQLFWISGSLATLVAVWALRHSLIPEDLITASQAKEKIKQRNNWVFITAILVAIPVYFILELFFGYDTRYCFGCQACTKEWRCWWSFAHYKAYPPNKRIWEYLSPSLFILPFQVGSAMLARQLLKLYAFVK